MDYFSKIDNLMEPRLNKSPFEIDDWVEIGNGKMKGYVISVDNWENRACVQVTENYWNEHKGRLWVKFHNLTKLQQETDPNILIDLALATRDKEWFTQLTRGME